MTNRSISFRKNARVISLVAVPALVLGLACASNTWAQAASAPDAASSAAASSKVAHVDSAFLKDAAEGGAFEVEASKIALSKSHNDQVKTFAQQMVDGHSKVGSELATLAASKGVKVPTEPSLADKAKLKILNMRDGASFDAHYAKTVGVTAHEDTIKLFEKYIKDGKDADVKAFATKTLPALQHHLEMARDLKVQADKIAK
ncbi:MAG: DUF4142 domain-containing protein [Aquabacterium sp.]